MSLLQQHKTLHCHWNLQIFTLIENERKILKTLKSLIRKKNHVWYLYHLYYLYLYWYGLGDILRKKGCHVIWWKWKLSMYSAVIGSASNDIIFIKRKEGEPVIIVRILLVFFHCFDICSQLHTPTSPSALRQDTQSFQAYVSCHSCPFDLTCLLHWLCISKKQHT